MTAVSCRAPKYGHEMLLWRCDWSNITEHNIGYEGLRDNFGTYKACSVRGLGERRVHGPQNIFTEKAMFRCVTCCVAQTTSQSYDPGQCWYACAEYH